MSATDDLRRAGALSNLRAGALSILLAVPTACGGTGPGVVDLDAEERAIREISGGWLEHAQARNVDPIVNYFAPDGLVLEVGEPALVGHEAIRADIEEDWAANPDFTIDWETISVTVAAAGDMAWERGRWTFDPDGPGTAPAIRGEYITVYVKVDGEWKVAADIGVPTEPLPGSGGDTVSRVERTGNE